ncbi:hypothetical protein QEP77_06845 [Serratia sp. B1]|nr:hypothetical protein QEP77_06845 [Serratia sp. B1]
MNEFERKIREAMAVTRNNATPRLPASGSVGKTTAEIAALSFGARALAAKLRPGSAGVATPPNPSLMKRKALRRKAASPRRASARPRRRRPRAGCSAAPR